MRIIRSTPSVRRHRSATVTHLLTAVGLLGYLAACAEAPVSPATDLAQVQSSDALVWSGEPVYQPGNPSCTSLGYLSGTKVNSPVIGSPITEGPVTFTFESNTTLGSWSSTVPIDAVIMKAGPGALIFSYIGGATSGGGEYTPNNSAGIQAGISHIEFCRYGRFTVGVTDPTSYTRDYDWTIAKAASAPTSIAKGTPLIVAYTVSMSRDSVDFDFEITGTISVANIGNGASGIVQGLSVDAAGVLGDVMCDGITFPMTLADGGSFVCEYSVQVPDASTRLITATVTVDESGPWRSSSVTTTAEFGEPTLLIDDVVTIFDTRVPEGLGTLTAPGDILYGVTYGPYEACVPVEIGNIASFLTDDTGEVGADTASVVVDVTGCSGDDPVIGTAFAFSGNQTTAFSALGLATRWGWTINFGGPSTKTYDVYVGAGQNDLSKGTMVGTVTITYTGSAVTAVYDLLPGFSVLEQHLYAGSLMAPQMTNGKKTSYTVAPGRYTVSVSGGDIWVIAHSVIGYTEP